jgi:hypothetical protein
MLTMIDLHQDKELSRSEMGKVAGGSPLVDHLTLGIKSAGENGTKSSNGDAYGFGYGIALGIGLILGAL